MINFKRVMKSSNHQNSDNKWLGLISFLIIVVAVLHYTTPTKLYYLHELYRAFFYFPIILAAFRYQFKGGLTAAVVVILLYLPHVVFQWGGNILFNFSRFLEMVMYIVVGGVAGYLAKRERNERNRYQQTASELEKSYKQLKSQSEKMAEMEEQLRTSERLSILGELAASLAHEVRNPLGSIWGVVEIIKDEWKKEGKDSEFAEILIQEVKRLNQVVENYSNLARQPKLHIKACKLQEVIGSVIYLLNHKAQKQGIQIKTDFPGKPIWINANENQLQQILINLILNSMAAIEDKGTVTIKAEIQHLDKKAEKSTDHQVVRLSIIDSGHGIDPVAKEKIFDPFFTTREDGTGLGLSIVKRIADQNRWNIAVETALGRGTKITITFPWEAKDAQSV
jgi:signal transduction histidine kinase